MIKFKTQDAVSNYASLATPPTLGKVDIAFADMGQGDYTIISMPDNSVFVVDCGSNARFDAKNFEETRQTLRAWAGGKKVKLIITHPDKDHNNKFIELLIDKRENKAISGVKVGTIFFSRAKNSKSPLGYYSASALLKNIRLLGKPELIEVTINAGIQSKNVWSFDKELYRKEPKNYPIPNSELVLVDGTTTKGTRWKLSIIAGNVPTTSKTSSIMSNVVSLCTMLKFDDKTMLLTGDATQETLTYLQSTHNARIKDVEILQLPHHGSEGSVISESFAKHLNPAFLLVSAGWANNNNSLPRHEAIYYWLGSPRLDNENIDIDYWRTGIDDYDSYQKLVSILKEKWKDYEVDHSDSDSFHCLKKPEEAALAGTPFYGFSAKGFFLFRESVKKSIYQTGLHGNCQIGISD